MGSPGSALLQPARMSFNEATDGVPSGTPNDLQWRDQADDLSTGECPREARAARGPVDSNQVSRGVRLSSGNRRWARRRAIDIPLVGDRGGPVPDKRAHTSREVRSPDREVA